MSAIEGLIPILNASGEQISNIRYRVGGVALDEAMSTGADVEGEIIAVIQRLIASDYPNCCAGNVQRQQAA